MYRIGTEGLNGGSVGCCTCLSARVSCRSVVATRFGPLTNSRTVTGNARERGQLSRIGREHPCFRSACTFGAFVFVKTEPIAKTARTRARAMGRKKRTETPLRLQQPPEPRDREWNSEEGEACTKGEKRRRGKKRCANEMKRGDREGEVYCARAVLFLAEQKREREREDVVALGSGPPYASAMSTSSLTAC